MPHITSRTDYEDKLEQADTAYSNGNYRLAYDYYNSCLIYAERNGMNTSYLEMKVEDCSKRIP